jgi:hypothetical protein
VILVVDASNNGEELSVTVPELAFDIPCELAVVPPMTMAFEMVALLEPERVKHTLVPARMSQSML